MATAASDAVALVFVFDIRILNRLDDRDDRRVTFIHDSLVEIDDELRRRGSRLVVRYGDPVREVVQVASALGVDALYVNRDYEPYAKDRDADIARALASRGIAFHDFKDQVVFDRDQVVTGAGTPYKVYTPYRRAWNQALVSPLSALPPDLSHDPDLDRLLPVEYLDLVSQNLSMERTRFRRNDLWLRPGSSGGTERLDRFVAVMSEYGALRNIAALDATSGLSAHLRFGTLSSRQMLRRARAVGGEGAEAWIGELVWRDFFHMILDHFPHVVRRAFRSEFNEIEWPGDDDAFNAWTRGATGYPIVDAAMRNFNDTGWMHNRLRMIVASFLVKDLLVDWRRGESWFARRLLDFDLAINNGNWQWVASTGADAQPYFRIFNPVEQSRRFDPEGIFIRRHLPELARFSNRAIHFPSSSGSREQEEAGCIIGRDYPAPIVDHAVQRRKALGIYAAARKTGGR